MIPGANSLGGFYKAFIDLLGFERHNDEWKVTGFAAYGEPTYNLADDAGAGRASAPVPSDPTYTSGHASMSLKWSRS